MQPGTTQNACGPVSTALDCGESVREVPAGAEGPARGVREVGHARTGDGVVTRTDDVPEGAVLAPGDGAPQPRGARAAAEERARGDRDPGHHRRQGPAHRGCLRGPAPAAPG